MNFLLLTGYIWQSGVACSYASVTFLSDTGSIRTWTRSGSRLDSYFGRFVNDQISMWPPGPHQIGLRHLQVGMSMQIDITEPYVPSRCARWASPKTACLRRTAGVASRMRFQNDDRSTVTHGMHTSGNPELRRNLWRHFLWRPLERLLLQYHRYHPAYCSELLQSLQRRLPGGNEQPVAATATGKTRLSVIDAAALKYNIIRRVWWQQATNRCSTHCTFVHCSCISRKFGILQKLLQKTVCCVLFHAALCVINK